MNASSLCHIRNLSVRYRGRAKPSLTDLSMDLVAGERLAIVGESGSGKSTFVRALADLLAVDTECTGSIQWSADRSARPGRDLGFVFQDASASLNPVLNVGEQVAEGARRHLGLSWPAAYAHAETLLRQMHLPNAEATMRAYPHQLSGGQRQRVAIAAAIASQPSILIADEVTSALDMVVQAGIVALLNELVTRSAMTLIFVTHDIALASNLADRIAVFKDGRLVEIGPTGQILNAPASDYTRVLIESHYDLTSRPLISEGL
jgi:peptide/nickel transport system ATP-binding protein